MKVKLKLFIYPGGAIKAVYDDRLAELGLGLMEVTRATRVEFNSKAQTWEARDNKSRVIACDRSRQKCLEFEHAAVENILRWDGRVPL